MREAYERRLEQETQNKALKDKLLRALRRFQPNSKLIAKLKGCCAGVSVDGSGDAHVFVRSCGVKNCPYCFARRQSKSKKVLQRVFNKAEEFVKEHQQEGKREVFSYFITLTVDPKKRGVPKSAKGRMLWLNKELVKFYNRSFVRKHFLGSYRRMEVTNTSSNHNWHAHATVLSHMPPQQFERRLKKDWQHGFAFNKKWTFGTLHLEHSKSQLNADTRLSQYLHKAFSMDMPDETLAELVEAMSSTRCRTTVATGLFRGWKKEAEASINEEYKTQQEELKASEPKAMPKPPKGVRALKEGKYSILSLLQLALGGNRYARYCLQLFEWLTRLGTIG